jgi:hypothetical protein
MMTGRVNTSVLPDPVKAMPIMSRPDRLSGEDSFRTGPAGDSWISGHGFSVAVMLTAHTYMVGMPWI